MAHVNKVCRSINAPCGTICVDIFARPDGTFGFDEYRRDVEDTQEWFSIAHYAGQVFATVADALRGARQSVAWLGTVLSGTE